MQTFLPYASFVQSARVLDNQRLGKQRVECLQLLNALTGKSSGWINHPAAKMWRGWEYNLMLYGEAICTEWKNRGFKDTCLEKLGCFGIEKTTNSPPWLGDLDLHASHRSNLLRKNPTHYGQFGWNEPDDLPYVWPCN